MVPDRRDSGVFNAVRLCHGGDRLHPGEERRKHHHEKPDGFLYRNSYVYASRIRFDDERELFLWFNR